MEELSAYNHKITFPIRFMDLDPMQHVNNARYLNFLEEARIAYWKDVLKVKLDSAEFNAVVARVEIDYKAPIFFNEEVTVYSRVSKIGNKSMTYDCAIVAEKEGKKKLAAHSLTTIVKLNPNTLKPEPIDEKTKSVIRNFETLSKKV